MKQFLDNTFEVGLWGARYLVLFPVVFGIIGAAVLVVIATWEMAHLVEMTWGFFSGAGHVSSNFHKEAIVGVISAVDIYLISVVLLMFSFGLYEIFVSDITPRESQEDPDNSQEAGGAGQQEANGETKKHDSKEGEGQEKGEEDNEKSDKKKGKDNGFLIENVDDLKTKVAKVIVMVLMVRFFQHVIDMEVKEPIHIVYFGGGILLLASAIFLLHRE